MLEEFKKEVRFLNDGHTINLLYVAKQENSSMSCQQGVQTWVQHY